MTTSMYDSKKFPYAVQLLHAPDPSGWENLKKSLSVATLKVDRVDFVATLWLIEKRLRPMIDYDIVTSVKTEKGITVAIVFTYAFSNRYDATEFALCNLR